MKLGPSCRPFLVSLFLCSLPAFGQGFGFGAPAPLNVAALSDSSVQSEFTPKIRAGLNGRLVAMWLGNGPGQRDLFFRVSDDGGETWGSERTLVGSTCCADERHWLDTDGQGVWIAAWQSEQALGGSLGIDPDILFSRSTDNADTWSAPAALYGYAATDSGFAAQDTDATVYSGGSGVWLSAWRSANDLGGTLGSDADVLFVRFG